ncbi:MAG TPA: serine hydrolase domain-containing protein [Dehalococcoidia bacterium]|nr:serine hydrolase domain-containing protein [Dehalococcoidia bacterium]
MVRTAGSVQQIEAAPEDVGLTSEGMAKLKRHVQGYVDAGKFPGAISMVQRRGKVVHFETYGQSDREAGKPVERDTIFRIYSMTKPIVSVGLMTLYEEGLFQIDDPVSKYIPRFAGLKVLAGGTADAPRLREPSREMTIADLLRHTSGLVSKTDSVLGEAYTRLGLLTSESNGTLAEMVEKLGSLPLKCDPGTQFNYGISTDVIGHLCEVLSGQNLDDFLGQQVLGPLGMVDTGFYVPADDVERFAACYRPGKAGEPLLVAEDRPDESSRYTKPRTYLSGAGGMVSTASDYMRFCKMLANGGELEGRRVIGPRTLEFMALNHLPGGRDLSQMSNGPAGETSREGVGFGLGFARVLDATVLGGLSVPGEYYWGGAASTAFWITPAEDLAVVFMTQVRPSSTYPIRKELRSIIYGSIAG